MKLDGRGQNAGGEQLYPRNLDPELSSVTPTHKANRSESPPLGLKHGENTFPTHSHSPRNFFQANHPYQANVPINIGQKKHPYRTPTTQKCANQVEENVALLKQTFGHQEDPTVREAVIQANFVAVMRREAEVKYTNNLRDNDVHELRSRQQHLEHQIKRLEKVESQSQQHSKRLDKHEHAIGMNSDTAE